ncbi:MAG: (2Fe-2S)-binding protein [Myxococcota bacterium]
MITLTVNGKTRQVDVPADTPLLWVIREELKLTGTRFGCGMSLCGACTVHIDGQPTRSCVLPVNAVGSRSVTTIEGLGGDHPVQKAWQAENVPQCGYCQSGQIMSAVGLLNENPKPTDEQINASMRGNICRCGTYNRIRKAIHRASSTMSTTAATDCSECVKGRVVKAIEGGQ